MRSTGIWKMEKLYTEYNIYIYIHGCAEIWNLFKVLTKIIKEIIKTFRSDLPTPVAFDNIGDERSFIKGHLRVILRFVIPPSSTHWLHCVKYIPKKRQQLVYKTTKNIQGKYSASSFTHVSDCLFTLLYIYLLITYAN